MHDQKLIEKWMPDVAVVQNGEFLEWKLNPPSPKQVCELIERIAFRNAVRV